MIDISVRKSRANFELDVDVKFGSGITAFFGASRAGKSSLLNLIAGLEQPDSGRIRIGSEVLFDSKAKINLAVHKRRIGYVFQDALLLPHLTVRGNLRYGLRQGGMEFSPDRGVPWNFPSAGPPARNAVRRRTPAGGHWPRPPLCPAPGPHG